MKKIVAVILLSCISLFAMAEYFEINGKIPCASSEEVLGSLKEFEESPLWYGNVSDTVKAVLLVNLTTTTWTFLISSESKICVITSGRGFSYRSVSKGVSL